jgi:hypothetical protein
MPWQVRYLADIHVIETVYSGRFSVEELNEVVVATLDLGREEESNLYLGDCSHLEAPDSLVDVYGLVEFYESLPVDRRSKEAIVLPAAQKAQADLVFYETAALNRGFEVRVFVERDAAIAWLTEPSAG